MHKICISFFVFSTLIGSLFFSSFAVASERKSEAKKHFQAGTTLLKNEDFSGAVLEFGLAVQLYPTKNGLFNLANCYKAERKYSKALKALSRLKQEFGDELDGEMFTAVENLEKDIQAIVGELVIHVKQYDALVEVNGKNIGTTPLDAPLILGAGEYTIHICKEGFESKEIMVSLISGDIIVKRISLSPITEKTSAIIDSASIPSEETKQKIDATSDASTSMPTPVTSMPEQTKGETSLSELESADKNKASGAVVVGAISLVLGVGAAAAGGYYTIRYSEHKGDSEDDMLSIQKREDSKDLMSGDKRGMIFGYGTAAVLVTTAVVLITIGKLKASKKTSGYAHNKQVVWRINAGGMTVSF